MDHCPPELHSYICSLACTDDGFTARSLSLVSKYFSQITLPYLYQSLSVTGASQIIALARRLQKVPPHRRPVHHLYLSDSDHPQKPGIDQELTQSIFTILSLATPTLETLTFVASSPATSTTIIARLFRLTFPRLHDLTILGHYSFPSVSTSFPSLERLHLLGNRNPHGLLHLGALESCMPMLAELRISGLSLAVSFSRELLQAFTPSSEDDKKCLLAPKLPSRMKQVIVQCGPEMMAGRMSASALLKDEMMVRNLEDLRERVNKSGHRTLFSLLPRSASDASPEDVHKEWVDSLRSKEGCWKSA